MIKVDSINKLFLVASLAMFVACVDNNTNNSNSSPSSPNSESSAPAEEKTAYPEGKTVYQKTCIACHGTSGEGTQGMYPPLAKSDFLLADKSRTIYQVLKGSSTTYTVNGSSYNGVMPPQGLSDEEVTQVLNYVYHAWGNNGFVIGAADIKAVRDTIGKKK